MVANLCCWMKKNIVQFFWLKIGDGQNNQHPMLHGYLIYFLLILYLKFTHRLKPSTLGLLTYYQLPSSTTHQFSSVVLDCCVVCYGFC
jgi:hypothetical protein